MTMIRLRNISLVPRGKQPSDDSRIIEILVVTREIRVLTSWPCFPLSGGLYHHHDRLTVHFPLHNTVYIELELEPDKYKICVPPCMI